MDSSRLLIRVEKIIKILSERRNFAVNANLSAVFSHISANPHSLSVNFGYYQRISTFISESNNRSFLWKRGGAPQK
ncbi:hypothetical protein BACCIP111895_03462 [Neobacillus rhizosphaerae]|uniref:Uncharacterized protein n=1 Tax=Neobacillus rhizosphaerae TaxID=2880965 RepID=A0ABM9EUC9_9BACI|nr:hypothetical protein BACCIP111895_03462 [Neobacillus rhizosphaerae]